jgi:hypothetical protein
MSSVGNFLCGNYIDRWVSLQLGTPSVGGVSAIIRLGSQARNSRAFDLEWLRCCYATTAAGPSFGGMHMQQTGEGRADGSFGGQ